MSHRLGVYLAPGHNRPSDLDYIARLQPPVVRILDPDVQHIVNVYKAAPQARIGLRWWALDDHNGDRKRELYADPVGAAKRLAAEYRTKVDALYTTGVALPPRSQLLFNAWNEPATWEIDKRAAITEGNRVLALECAAAGLPLAVGCFAVGHPHEWPPVWDWFEPAIDAIRQYPLHCLELHEYWQQEGPNHGEDWGALAGRHTKCPYPVPILIGECGVDSAIYGRTQGNVGWRHYMNAETYAGQLGDYVRQCDSRVFAVLPFLTDYRDRFWGSFDTQDAHGAILNLLQTRPAREQPQVFVPSVHAGPPTPVQPPQPDNDDAWRRSIEWVLRWEGGLSTDPNDPGNWYEGRLVGTKFGISAATWGGQYDIPNLTREQAEAIYFEHYWRASGADRLEWPLCLIVFDTAVLHGVSTAVIWLEKAGPNPYAFAAKRMRVYTKLEHGQHFWRGWLNRLADLMEAMSQS